MCEAEAPCKLIILRLIFWVCSTTLSNLARKGARTQCIGEPTYAQTLQDLKPQRFCSCSHSTRTPYTLLSTLERRAASFQTACTQNATFRYLCTLNTQRFGRFRALLGDETGAGPAAYSLPSTLEGRAASFERSSGHQAAGATATGPGRISHKVLIKWF
jgi:hypothetical protein